LNTGLARLCHRQFFALTALDQGLRGLLEQINQQLLKKQPDLEAV